LKESSEITFVSKQEKKLPSFFVRKHPWEIPFHYLFTCNITATPPLLDSCISLDDNCFYCFGTNFLIQNERRKSFSNLVCISPSTNFFFPLLFLKMKTEEKFFFSCLSCNILRRRRRRKRRKGYIGRREEMWKCDGLFCRKYSNLFPCRINDLQQIYTEQTNLRFYNKILM
jgi:hypothetical protein